MFVRVEDQKSGHQYDLPEDVAEHQIKHSLVKRVKSDQWPDSPTAREPLYRTDKAGNPAPRANPSADTTAGA